MNHIATYSNNKEETDISMRNQKTNIKQENHQIRTLTA